MEGVKQMTDINLNFWMIICLVIAVSINYYNIHKHLQEHNKVGVCKK